jgi:hypothetical protein
MYVCMCVCFVLCVHVCLVSMDAELLSPQSVANAAWALAVLDVCMHVCICMVCAVCMYIYIYVCICIYTCM